MITREEFNDLKDWELVYPARSDRVFLLLKNNPDKAFDLDEIEKETGIMRRTITSRLSKLKREGKVLRKGKYAIYNNLTPTGAKDEYKS